MRGRQLPGLPVLRHPHLVWAVLPGALPGRKLRNDGGQLRTVVNVRDDGSERIALAADPSRWIRAYRDSESDQRIYWDDHGFFYSESAALGETLSFRTGDRVYTFGVGGRLRAHRVADGELLWEVDTSERFGVIQNFFGVGSTPVVESDLILVMVGGSPPESPDLDSNQTIQQNFSVGYEDECSMLGLTYRRDRTRTRNVEPDNAILLTFTLKSLVN